MFVTWFAKKYFTPNFPKLAYSGIDKNIEKFHKNQHLNTNFANHQYPCQHKMLRWIYTPLKIMALVWTPPRDVFDTFPWWKIKYYT